MPCEYDDDFDRVASLYCLVVEHVSENSHQVNSDLHNGAEWNCWKHTPRCKSVHNILSVWIKWKIHSCKQHYELILQFSNNLLEDTNGRIINYHFWGSVTLTQLQACCFLLIIYFIITPCDTLSISDCQLRKVLFIYIDQPNLPSLFLHTSLSWINLPHCIHFSVI
jgi:hypothetical protein